MVFTMPRAFNDHEEKHIRSRLRSTGRERFASRGVLKTTIEEIARAAGIAKGSFYKFYDSKELLFFELLEDSQNRIRDPLTAGAPAKAKRTRRAFERLIWDLFDEVCADPLIQFMGRESELLSVMRKVPPEKMALHQAADQAFLDDLIGIWNRHATRPEREVVAARTSTLMLVSMNRNFLGDRLFEPAAGAAIASLADCFFKSVSLQHHQRPVSN